MVERPEREVVYLSPRASNMCMEHKAAHKVLWINQVGCCQLDIAEATAASNRPVRATKQLMLAGRNKKESNTRAAQYINKTQYNMPKTAAFCCWHVVGCKMQWVRQGSGAGFNLSVSEGGLLCVADAGPALLEWGRPGVWGSRGGFCSSWAAEKTSLPVRRGCIDPD